MQVSRTEFVGALHKRFDLKLNELHALIQDIEHLFKTVGEMQGKLKGLDISIKEDQTIYFKLSAKWGKRMFKFDVKVSPSADTIEEVEVKELTKKEFDRLNKDLNKTKSNVKSLQK